MKSKKPLGRKAYGSIPHLPGSRLGPSDRSVDNGQDRVCTRSPRDKFDRVIVQEKLDGSCTAVAKVDGKILALGRAGYLATSSPFEMHHLFAGWVEQNRDLFFDLLSEGERIVGEWVAHAHGTLYDLSGLEPWFAFDLMEGSSRVPFDEFASRIDGKLQTPLVISDGPPIATLDAMKIHKVRHHPCDDVEGVVYRVERKGELDFLAKWVRSDKIDGKYLPEISGKPAVWLWKPLTLLR